LRIEKVIGGGQEEKKIERMDQRALISMLAPSLWT